MDNTAESPAVEKPADHAKVEVTIEQLNEVVRAAVHDEIEKVAEQLLEIIREEINAANVGQLPFHTRAIFDNLDDLPKLDIPAFSVGRWPEAWNDLSRASLYDDED